MKKEILGFFMAGVLMGALMVTGCENPASGSPPSQETPVPVAVTGVALDHTTRTIPQGNTATLTATVSPSGAENTAVTWSTSDSGVATVAGTGATATVTGVAPGTATITVTTADGEYTDTCTVTVTLPVTGIAVSLEAVTAYHGEPLDMAAIKMTVTYSGGSSAQVSITEGVITGYDETTPGEKSVTVTYGGQTDTFTVTVKPVASIVVTEPAKKDYSVGEALALADMVVTAHYDDGHTRVLDPAEYTVGGYTPTTAGTQTITINTTYAYAGNPSKSFTVKVWYKITEVTVAPVPPATTQISKSDLANGAQTIPFSATVHAEQGTPPQTVVWSIDEAGKAEGTTIGSSTGVLTIATAETLEKLTIKATNTYQGVDTVVTVGTATVVISTIIDVTTGNWANTFSDISNADGGTADNPKVWVLKITGTVTVAGTSAANIGNGTYKEVWLTGTGTISLSADGSIINIGANQTFVLDGPALQGRTGNTKAVVDVGSGTFIMESGTISGNTNTGSSTGGNNNKGGGGVYVGEGGTFTMDGGTISGNTANYGNGGGVYSNGAFTMKNASVVKDNKTTGTYTFTNGDGDEIAQGYDGGGVYIGDGGTIAMEGGTISGNTTDHGNGGGVYSKGAVTMKNTCVIKDNKTTGTNTGTDGDGNAYVRGYDGGGVYSKGAVTMNGGTISGNTTDYGNGGGVYVGSTYGEGKNVSGTFTMEGGTISGNTTDHGYGGGVYCEGAVTMKNGVIKDNKTTGTETGYGGDGSTYVRSYNGGGVYIQGMGEAVSVTIENSTISGNTVTGYGGGVYVYRGTGTIKNSEISDNTGGGVNVYSSSFTLQNSKIEDNTGTGVTFSGEEESNDGTFTMNNCTIDGNTNTGELGAGGGVSVGRGTLTMTDSTISNNSASFGGGVYIDGSGAVTMKGTSTISGNTATASSFYGIVIGGGGVGVFLDGTFTMESGTISGNKATAVGAVGGGVLVYEKFEMKGGTISGNTADNHGGGVYVKALNETITNGDQSMEVTSSGIFTMSGGTIHGSNATSALKNTAGGQGAAVYVHNGSPKESTITTYP
jgi:hypothetical protein